MLSTKISMVLFLHEWAVIKTPGSKLPDFKEPALAGFFMAAAWGLSVCLDYTLN